MKILLVMIIAASLAGCETLAKVLPGRVAVPIECKETMPTRPSMPTELLGLDASVDAYVQAAEAELQRREGYEGDLRTALATCIKPIK